MTAIPVPVPDELSARFWSAAFAGVLCLPRCSDCGHIAMPPDIVCSACASPQPSFIDEPLSGLGRIRSWTVVRTAFLPGFSALVPYVLVDVELDEQDDLRLVARLLEDAPTDLAAGQRVEARFAEIAEGVFVPGFVRTA